MSAELPPAERAGNRVVKLFGAMLMAIGGLIATLCGLCSLGFVGFGLYGAVRNAAAPGSALIVVPLALVVGGIPFAIGAGVFAAGRKLYRNN
jgi:hypothetical protein